MFNISTIGIPSALYLIMRQMVLAGELALRLQSRIATEEVGILATKQGSRFAAVLTDADVLVESWIGCFLYITFEDIAFLGEEHDKDRISAYFPRAASYEITLDPINGTLFFKDGLPIFDIILTIRVDGKIIAAIDYMPQAKRFYIGIQHLGAFTTTAENICADKVVRDRDACQASVSSRWQPLHLNTSSRKILTHRPTPDVGARLEAAGYEVINLDGDYIARPDWTIATNSLLTGDVCALVKEQANVIDWGAIGFIAALAGGAWNDPIFDPRSGRGSLIAAASPHVYEDIQRVLNLR